MSMALVLVTMFPITIVGFAVEGEKHKRKMFLRTSSRQRRRQLTAVERRSVHWLQKRQPKSLITAPVDRATLDNRLSEGFDNESLSVFES